MCVVQEYLSSNDFKEVQICLSKINAPLAMHDLVKQALTKAMASNSESQILTLLERLSSEGSISEDQILKVLSARSLNPHLFSTGVNCPTFLIPEYCHIFMTIVQKLGLDRNLYFVLMQRSSQIKKFISCHMACKYLIFIGLRRNGLMKFLGLLI